MNVNTMKWLGGGFAFMILVSTFLIANDEWQPVVAWWTATALLLPTVLLALRSPFLTFRVVCFTAFFTQFATVPGFFLVVGYSEMSQAEWLNFSINDVLPIDIKLAAFLLLLALIFKAASHIQILPNRSTVVSNGPSSSKESVSVGASKRAGMYTMLIAVLIIGITPVNIWMFQNGISIVGVEPPALPYRLSGILHYLTRYIVPLTLGYLFYKTRHGLLPTLLLLAYGLLIGLTSISRSALVLILLPVLALAWTEKRRVVMFVASAGLLLGYALISRARDFVYFVSNGTSGAITGDGIFEVIGQLLEDSWIWEFRFLLDTFTAILNRIEGFENLVRSSLYDPNAIEGGALGFILRIVWRPLAEIDLDSHHIEWQGNILPEGFVNGGALLSNMLIASNANLLWIGAAAMVSGVILISLESSVHIVARKYRLSVGIKSFLLILMSIIFFIEGGGSVTFVLPLIALLALSWLPQLSMRPPTSNRGRNIATG